MKLSYIYAKKSALKIYDSWGQWKINPLRLMAVNFISSFIWSDKRNLPSKKSDQFCNNSYIFHISEIQKKKRADPKTIVWYIILAGVETYTSHTTFCKSRISIEYLHKTIYSHAHTHTATKPLKVYRRDNLSEIFSDPLWKRFKQFHQICISLRWDIELSAYKRQVRTSCPSYIVGKMRFSWNQLLPLPSQKKVLEVWHSCKGQLRIGFSVLRKRGGRDLRFEGKLYTDREEMPWHLAI